MPRIISFSRTTPALLAGRKTVTRREWKPKYAAQWKAGDEAIAYDVNPRNGGKPVARIRLLQAPYLECSAGAPDADYEAEGFAYLTEQDALVFGQRPADLWREWHEQPRDFYVVRFELIEILSALPAAEGVAL